MNTLCEFTDPSTGEYWSLEQNGPDLLLCHIPDDAGAMASIPLPLPWSPRWPQRRARDGSMTRGNAL